MNQETKKIVMELDEKLQAILTNHWEILTAIAAKEGCTIKIICGLRTQAEQDELWKQGRSKPGRRVTWNRHSKHQDGLAVDFGIFYRDTYLDEKDPWTVHKIYHQFAEHLEPHGIKWLGPIGDDCHFELRE